MVMSMERLRSIRTFVGAGFALVALACGSSSSSGGAVQQACKTDLDCKHGQTCRSNICQGLAACKSSSDCLNGQECSPDLVCVPIGGGTGGAGTGGQPTGSGGIIGGGLTTGSGGIISGGGSGGCTNDNLSCTVNGDCCGYPSSSHCVNFGTSATCAHLCTTASDCPTNCCVGLTTNGTSNGLSACGPASACATTGSGGAPPGTGGSTGTGGCVGDLGSCSTNGDCCGYPNANRCWDPGSGAVCAIVCTSGTDCVSGCCLLLNSGYSVCAPGSFCQ